MIQKSRQHLDKSKEKYWPHMIWAIVAGVRLILVGITSIIHGVIPSLFPGAAAKTVIDLYHKRLKNHPNTEYQEYIKNSSKN
jgi:hypothetical protein